MVAPSLTVPLMVGVKPVPEPVAGIEPVAAGETDAAVIVGATASTVAVTLEALALPAGSVIPDAAKVGLIVPAPAAVAITVNVILSPLFVIDHTTLPAVPALLISLAVKLLVLMASEKTIVNGIGGDVAEDDFTNELTVGATLSFW